MASRTSCGRESSGPVTVSVSGMPRRSVRQTMRWPLSFTSRQESSSSETWVIGEVPPFEGQAAVEADDGRALEAGGNAAVEILFPGDVDLVDDVHAHGEADFDGHVEGRPG